MDLDQLRAKLDETDDALLGLFQQRMDTVRQVAQYKACLLYTSRCV